MYSKNTKFFVLEQDTESLALEHACRASYSLPTFLVSYPRSGSNFLQSVLERSSGLCCRSIYSGPYHSAHRLLSIKSHAISLQHLDNEINCLVRGVLRASKLVLLHRDPRDVMISYYEYTQAKKNAKIEQGEFLDDCYFLPNPIAQECLEKVLEAPLRVVEAYKEHVRHWFVEPVHGADCIVVRFEDLVKRRHSEFQRVFDFLELGVPIAEHLTDVMTSLYSSEGRQRGQAYGWKDSTSRYGELLRAVNLSLGDEIVALGYEL